jgi:hypothetical protein
VNIAEAAGAIGQAELAQGVFDIGQAALGLEGLSYRCIVLPDGAFSFLDLGPLNGGPILLRCPLVGPSHPCIERVWATQSLDCGFGRNTLVGAAVLLCACAWNKQETLDRQRKPRGATSEASLTLPLSREIPWPYNRPFPFHRLVLR